MRKRTASEVGGINGQKIRVERGWLVHVSCNRDTNVGYFTTGRGWDGERRVGMRYDGSQVRGGATSGDKRGRILVIIH